MKTTLSLTADLKDIATVTAFVMKTAAAQGSDAETVDEIIVALHEAISNTIIHGYKRQPGAIEVEVKRQGDNLAVYVRDDAPLFDPTTVPTPDISLPLHQRPYGGLGVHIMRNFTDELHYQITDGDQNELILVKKAVF